MTHFDPRKFLITAGAMAVVCLSPSARAGQSYDTTPGWDGASSIGAFGPASADDTPTYGETFVAPAGNTYLNSYTFYVGSSDGATGADGYLPDAVGDQYSVIGEVFNWTGGLQAGNPSQGTTGPALYTSPSFTVTSDGAFDAVTVTIPGGLSLVAGDSYVVDLTDLTGPSSNFGVFGDTEFGHVANDGGGGFNYSNIGEVGTWDDGYDFGDLAFTANFSSGSSAVPDASSTAALVGVALAGLSLLARRQRASARS
jgi:hypothetical protein